MFYIVEKSYCKEVKTQSKSDSPQEEEAIKAEGKIYSWAGATEADMRVWDTILVRLLLPTL